VAYLVPQIPGGVYHVTQRGHRRSPLFRADVDRSDFLGLLGSAVLRYEWDVYAWCLMDNHVHVLLRTRHGNLSRGMGFLTALYARRFNERYGIRGTPFQGKYRAFLVEDEEYFGEILRYVVLNPVKAGLVEAPEEWPWSSHRATMGIVPAPRWFQAERVLGRFFGRREEYRLHVANRMPSRRLE
jgi:REP element-mobilizing transposase RayT